MLSGYILCSFLLIVTSASVCCVKDCFTIFRKSKAPSCIAFAVLFAAYGVFGFAFLLHYFTTVMLC